jgi:hypothetical protein
MANEPQATKRQTTAEEFGGSLRKVLAYDKAIAELQQAGLAEAFVTAIQKDPELLSAINKLTPGLGLAASPGWSCCVTVSNPLRRPGEEVINPAVAGPRG